MALSFFSSLLFHSFPFLFLPFSPSFFLLSTPIFYKSEIFFFSLVSFPEMQEVVSAPRETLVSSVNLVGYSTYTSTHTHLHMFIHPGT